MNPELKRQRFKYLLEQAELKPATLAKRISKTHNIEFSASIFYNFLNGWSDTFEPSTIELVAPFLNIQPENFWNDKFILRAKESGNLGKDTLSQISQPAQTGSRQTLQNTVDDVIPLYGSDIMSPSGNIRFTRDYVRASIKNHPLLIGVKEPFAILVSGRAMVPRYRPGIRLYVNPNTPPTVGWDCAIEKDREGDIEIAEFMGETEMEWKFLQLNPEREYSIPKSGVYRIWTVIGTGNYD